ncbi:beta-galactosidase [Pedosphaera parvula]|uniref:Beta-galactosidase n=1 Tax=Pedosphaera parvula (strain Ellin514) TaxID=320771 RepID=B9XGU4_PEDPL|nr:beta-galactosidase [Pedosphaera parvula]EEF60865.1 Beta-galactosidase [Pedosphaera parvula Ellin514]
MYFGVDYYPEHWIYPYAGTPEEPEACWKNDAELMVGAGVNVVRMGEFTWGLCEPEEGKYKFDWLKRAMDVMGKAGIKVVLGTPTAAPPVWMAKKYPEILPLDEKGIAFSAGTRRACCLNSDVYWDFSRKIVREMATALGNHPQLIGWQIDNGLGGHNTECSYNEQTRRDWHGWLKAKYETVERLNQFLGTAHWCQMYSDWDHVPMPMHAPTHHNPALMLDWARFNSDTIVAFVKMQADILHELSQGRPVTSNLRALRRKFDHFDVAHVLDFVSIDSNATIKSKSSELACELDMLRSLKKTDIRTPDGDTGFWVIEQKAGHVNWQEVNSLLRPEVVRLFTYQCISRGACGILYFRWRQPRMGTEKFYGAILSHNGRKDGRTYKEIAQIGEELKFLAPTLKDTQVAADVCILYSHENDWSTQYGPQPTRHFNLRDHVQLFYNGLHHRNIPVDFARPTEDLSKYKLVIAPSLQLLAGGEADLLKLYVQNGGTLVGTFNTGLVDEHHMAPDGCYPHNMTDLFGLEVSEFDPLPPDEENHMAFKGSFPTSHMHMARVWCDLIEPNGCQILATFAKDFYSGRPAITMNTFGLGRAIYIGTMSHQHFYDDLIVWLRQLCNIPPLLKVPDTVEVSMRQKDNTRVFFLLNHQNSPVRIQFYKPMHDFLTSSTVAGNYELPPHGVLVLDEHPKK